MSDEVSRLWRIRKNALTMLENRGYLVADEEKNKSLADFRTEFQDVREKMTVLTNKIDDPTDQIFVFFSSDQKIGVQQLKNYVEKMKSQKINRGILVVKGGFSAFAKQLLPELTTRGITLEHFQEPELMINITDHLLVPKHEVLTEAQKKAVLKRYKLEETQLPRIQKVDPVARYFGLDKGHVVKIIRTSETAGRYVTYRLVM